MSLYKKIKAGLSSSKTIYFGRDITIEAKGVDQTGPAKFETMAYNGGPLSVAGHEVPVIIDLEAAKFERAVTKVNRNHEQKREVGHTLKQEIHRGPSYGIEFGGLFSVPGKDTDEIVNAARNQFPWDCSIEARYKKFDRYEKGQKVTVNGKEFAGPVIVARDALVTGLAILNTGADRGATVSIAAELTDEEFQALSVEPVLNSTQLQIQRLRGHGVSYEDIAAKANRGVSFITDIEAGVIDPPAGIASDLSSVTFVATLPTKDYEMSAEMKAALEAHGVTSVEQLEAKLANPTQQVVADQVIAAGAINPPNPLVDTDTTTKSIVAQRLAYANEMARIADIEKITAEYDMPKVNVGTADSEKWVSLRAHAVANGWNASDVENKSMHWQLRELNANATPAIHDAVQFDQDLQVVEAAMLMTSGMPESVITANGYYDERVMNEAVSDRFRGYRSSNLGHQCIKAAGMHIRAGQVDDHYLGKLTEAIRNGRSHRIQASTGFTTGSFNLIHKNVANKHLNVAYRRTASIVPFMFRRTSATDFKAMYSYNFESSGMLEEVGQGGEIKSGKVVDSEYITQLTTFAKKLEWTRKAMINDDLRALATTMEKLGTMAFNAREFMAIQTIIGAQYTTPVPTNPSVVGNAILGNPFGIGGMTESTQAFTGMTDPSGLPVNISGGCVLLPSSLTVVGSQVKNSTEIREEGGPNARAYSTQNPHAGTFDCLATPWLNNAKVNDQATRDSDWYRVSSPDEYGAFEVCYLNGRDTPIVESSESDFDTLGMSYRGIFDFGFSAQDPRYRQKNIA